MVNMTDPQGQGDKDPVSQFSDPALMHSYAESPPSAYPGSAPGYGYPQQAGRPAGAPPQAWPPVPSHWFLAGLSIVLCLPLGVAACVYSLRVRVLLMRGDVPGALRASKRVRLLFWISLAIAVILYVVALATQGGSSTS